MARKKQKDEKSITWVVAGVMIVIAVVGWGCMASSYASTQSSAAISDQPETLDLPPRIPRKGAALVLAAVGILTFLYTAIEQLPNFPWVIGWHLSERIALPLGILVLEGLALLAGLFLKSLEKKLAQPYRPRR